MSDSPCSARLPRPWDDTVVYEAHVRGMTMLNPEVPAKMRGTYAGLAHPAVLGHLQELGVTAVELLPVFAFSTEPALAARGLPNYWGYNPTDFFAPHDGYAATKDAVVEFRAMVDTFHRADIEIILDVVYNHTAQDVLAPQWYRQLDSGPVDFSGCGNTVDSSRPEVQDLILASLRYWATEMAVDGFRFDLATALARDERHRVNVPGQLFNRIAADPVLKTRKLIVEPWDATAEGCVTGSFGAPFAEWNNMFRDDVRDYWRGAASGVGVLATRLAGSSDLFDTPQHSINFVTAHDGFTLRDVVSYEDRHNLANGENGLDGHGDNRSDNCGVEGEATDPVVIAMRQQRAANLMASTLLARGVPMLRMGDEFGHTQGGNNNAYCQDNPISWNPWRAEPGWDLRELIGQLARLRPAFTGARFLRPDEVLWFGPHGTPMRDVDWTDDRRTALGLQTAQSTLWLDAAATELWLRTGEITAPMRVSPLGLVPC